MEQGRISPPEARAAALSFFFDEEAEKIARRIKRVTSLAKGVDTNGAVVRKQQRILHLEKWQAELDDIRSFVLQSLTNPTQTSEVPSIRYYFVGKLDEIERRESRPSEVIFENGIVMGRQQERRHLVDVREDMFRIGNRVLSLLGEPPLVDEKIPSTI